MFNVNLRGMASCVKQAAHVMVEAREGEHCVHNKCHGDWRAVLGLVRSASLQLGVHGIRVNCVLPNAPGMHAVDMQRARESSGEIFSCNWNTSVEVVRQVCEKSASLKGVVLTARHVAEAALFLACEDSELVTGHDMMVDGGFIFCTIMLFLVSPL
ncbi:(-)-isopiperitenol/(-)-carveol dehydrogenase [Pyrus ussuriensis x Pyrus communis]|uniref:(-)-isopiperitenol/(-)-carveol dehydrogenase n=1 Tax=Pyrus ussuriensis x Pyrus communis TaxID=2448454 RepID=A0A5N5FL29_9ROSA|nr:(-)-isopiperitenol/(-)-carveol dehydrogenase [Pyrus ussuriensis x Pyrus communis]